MAPESPYLNASSSSGPNSSTVPSAKNSATMAGVYDAPVGAGGRRGGKGGSAGVSGVGGGGDGLGGGGGGDGLCSTCARDLSAENDQDPLDAISNPSTPRERSIKKDGTMKRMNAEKSRSFLFACFAYFDAGLPISFFGCGKGSSTKTSGMCSCIVFVFFFLLVSASGGIPYDHTVLYKVLPRLS